MSFQARLLPPPAVAQIAAATPANLQVRSVRPQPAIWLVMPCYNEANRLDAQHITEFVLAHPWLQLILVNDGSTDPTLTLLTQMQRRVPGQITVLDLAQNAGKAEAVRQGLLHAMASGADLTGYWDADLATPLEALVDFLQITRRHGQIDVVFGSRRRMLGHQIDRSLKRRMVSRLCSQMARLALGLPIADTQCGAKVLRRTPALELALRHPFSAGWLFDVELFARIAAATPAPRRAFYELPLSAWDEVAGSKVTGRAIVKAGFSMLALIADNRLGIVVGQAAVRTAAQVRVVTAAAPRIGT